MSRASKGLIVVGVLAVMTVAGWALIAGAIYAAGGLATVAVADRDQGLDIYIPVPMALLDLALVSVGTPAMHSAGLPSVGVGGAGVNLGEVGPVMIALLEEIDDLPDVTLIEVEDRNDHVRVHKVGRKLVVSVEDPRTSVEIAIPTHGVLRLAERLFD